MATAASDYNDLLKLGIDEVLSLARIGQRMQWVPVSEKKPEDQQEVIIFADSQVLTGFVFYAQDNVFMDYLDTTFNAKNVALWMPLPQPPEEGLG